MRRFSDDPARTVPVSAVAQWRVCLGQQLAEWVPAARSVQAAEAAWVELAEPVQPVELAPVAASVVPAATPAVPADSAVLVALAAVVLGQAVSGPEASWLCQDSEIDSSSRNHSSQTDC